LTSRAVIFRNGKFYCNGDFVLRDVKTVKGLIAEIAPEITPLRKDRVVDLQGLFVIPGLINAHDHLEFNLFPSLGNPPYKNYLEWTADVRANNTQIINDVLKVPLKYRLLWGAYKNIFSGVTTLVHHNQYYRQFYYNFPIGVFKNYQWIHSLKLDPSLHKKLSRSNKKPVIIHISEGTDETAQQELGKLIELNGLTEQTILVHGIGLSEQDINILIQQKIPLIWCPTSNHFLYHATSPIEKLFGKIPVALGTDSAISGGLSMFEEIRKARELKNLDMHDILNMATLVPASILKMNKGVIAPGAAADFLMFESTRLSPMETILQLSPTSIRCLVRNGIPIYGDVDLTKFFHDSKQRYSKIVVNDREKFIVGNFGHVVNNIQKRFPSFSWNTLGVNQIQF
jgi:cytosine/adenosine deaminase-related metal-dependent hydrolase